MKPIFCITLRLGTAAFIALQAAVAFAATNVAPTATIISAAMRPGTTLMDVTYQITDPDDATVKVRALAFKDGTRSFANVIRPVTWMEGSQTNIGDAITTGVNHTLTWDVRADWNIDLANVKFEVMCRDSRGLLTFDWLMIPAAGGAPQLTLSTNVVADQQVLDALFWQYADGDSALVIENVVLHGSTTSGVFHGVPLASGTNTTRSALPYLFKLANLDALSSLDAAHVASARSGVVTSGRWLAVNRPWAGITPVVGWGENQYGQASPPAGLTEVKAIAVNSGQGLAVKNDGTVVGWGANSYDITQTPAGLTNVNAVAVAGGFALALKNDGTVVGWGYNNIYGQQTIPTDLTNAIAVAAGAEYSLALKNDGTVVGWGRNQYGQASPPPGLTGVRAIAAGAYHSVALKNDGTVVAWGYNNYGQATTPSGLTQVNAIAAGPYHVLALKNDGTVAGWGANDYGVATPPPGLTGITAIATCFEHSLALKSDGTVVGWGNNNYGQATPSPGLTGIKAIAVGGANDYPVGKGFSIALKDQAP